MGTTLSDSFNDGWSPITVHVASAAALLVFFFTPLLRLHPLTTNKGHGLHRNREHVTFKHITLVPLYAGGCFELTYIFCSETDRTEQSGHLNVEINHS